jgi:hypothetical protein
MLAFVTPVLAFLKSPLGRYLLIGVMLLVLALAIHHSGYASGVKHEERAAAARLEVAKKTIAKREGKAEAITAAATSSLAGARAEIRYRTKTLVEKVPVYVSSKSDDGCSVPVGFVRLHDAAAGGAPGLPAAASGSLDAPSGLELSAALSTVIANYGVAYDWRAEAVTWRAWYAQQAAAWAKP